MSACQRLVARLIMDGGSWSVPNSREEKGVDCVTQDGNQEVFIQVVRPVDARIYRSLAQSGRFEDEKDIGSLADDLRKAIEHKDQKEFPRGRENTILAIDLRDFGAHAVREVAENFKQRYGTGVKALGFRSIWAVGPTEQYVVQLDL